MNWFSESKFIAGLLVFFLLGAAGAGYYFSGRHSAYKEAIDKFDFERSRVATLKRKQLYPSEENVKLIESSVTDYEGEVTKLQQALLKFQKPLNSTMKDTEFQQLAKERVAAVQKLAEGANLVLPENFYMGLLKYRLDVPEPAAVGLLDYQLKAIERLMEAMARSGVSELVALERETLDVESGDYEAPETAPPLEKYPLKLTLSGTHEAVRRFFNDISNDTEYFFGVRFFRLENSMKSGPERGEERSAEDENPDEDNPDAVDADEEAAASNHDAAIVMGNEEIEVFLVIDLVRFVEVE